MNCAICEQQFLYTFYTVYFYREIFSTILVHYKLIFYLSMVSQQAYA